MRLLTALLVIVAALSLGACGGEDATDDAGAPASGAPEPRDSVKVASDNLVRALKSGDCRALFEAARHSTKRAAKLSVSNAPPSKAECAELASFRKGFPGLRLDGPSQVFGSAAVVDGHMGRDPVATIFVLDLDRSWKVAVSSGSYPQVGSKPAADNEFDANVAKFVSAARGADCAEIHRLISVDSEILDHTPTREALCKAVKDTSDPRSFFTRIRKDPDAKPVRLGKTAEFAFYGLTVKPGLYYTLFAARQPARLPVTRAHARDALYNWYLAKE
jgi:hypothetical protein